MGLFKVLERTAPNTYRLDLLATWRTCAEFNVERLRPYLRRPDHLGGEAASPPPVIGADGRPEHEVQELLKFKMRWGRPFVLLRWAGHDASGDTWEPLDNLTNCEEAVAAFERATGRSLPRRAPPPPTAAAPPPRRCRFRWQVSRWTRAWRRRATFERRSWGARSSTGGPRTGGSAAPSPASARGAARNGRHTA